MSAFSCPQISANIFVLEKKAHTSPQDLSCEIKLFTLEMNSVTFDLKYVLEVLLFPEESSPRSSCSLSNVKGRTTILMCCVMVDCGWNPHGS